MNCKNGFPGEKIDDLMRNGLHIIQSSNLPKFNTDSILLANFPKIRDGWMVCDLCTGTGVIPLVLTTRASGLKITAVELDGPLVNMAQRSIELNQLQNQIKVVQGDVRHINQDGGLYDLITVNPPYFKQQTGVACKDMVRAQARHQLNLTLPEVIATGYTLLKDKGLLALVYNVDGLSDVLAQLTVHRLAVLRLRFIHHTVNTRASSCIIEAQKGVSKQMIVEPPVIIHQANGEFTPELQGVYFEGKSLESREY